MRHPAWTLAIAAALFLALIGCEGKSPTEPQARVPRGRLSGAVTIGPNCPNDSPSNPCPPAPGAFSQRKVLVKDAAGAQTLFTVDIDSHGFYVIDLVPGDYTIDIRKVGTDSSTDVPVRITMVQNQARTLNIRIDTGIR